MSRERGEKGKHGETDRQIVFAILHNQFRNPRGLTKKQIAEVVQAATKKDQDGVRKRVAHMLGDQSPLKQMLQMENVDLKHFYKFNLRNIKDAAVLYNFMHRGGDFLGDEEFDTYISENLLAYEEDLIDYLYLWNPYDQVYGLPRHLIEEYSDVHAVDFYPKQFKDVGPEKMKEVAGDFKVFESGVLEEVMRDPKRMGRLCKLIENFESFIARFDYSDYIIEFRDEAIPVPLETMEIPLDYPDYSDDVTRGDMYWFLEMWKDAWEEGIPLRSTLFYEGRIEELERLGIPIPGEDQKVIENQENEKAKVILNERGRTFEASDLEAKLWFKYGEPEPRDYNIRKPLPVTIVWGDASPEKMLKYEDEYIFVPDKFKPIEKYLIHPYVKFIESGGYYLLRWPVVNPKRTKNSDNKEEPKNELDNWIWKED